jgi:adenylate cyclase
MSEHGADPRLQAVIHDEASGALARGLAAMATTGIMGSLYALFLSLPRPALRWPASSVLILSLIGLSIAGLAWRRRLSVRAMRFTLLAYVSWPFFALLLSEASAPLGLATFLFGPIPTIIIVLVVLTGLTLDPRLSRMAGALGAALTFVAHALGRARLEALTGLDDDLHYELADAGVAALRSIVVLGAGFLTAAAAETSQRLIQRVRDEEASRQSLNRLFGQYVSAEVRDKVVREGGHPRGERHVVAVLFSDLRGFTSWSERTPPAEVVERLNQYFDRMVAAIDAHGGTVDKFIGDAVMAVFGGVRQLDRPADAALAAARAMRRELDALNAQWTGAGLPPLDNGIGVHFGEVLQGPIGAASRKEFTVIGDTVNTASRIEGTTRELGVGIVLSADAARALSPTLQEGLRPLGEVQLKGKTRIVAVFAGDEAPRVDVRVGEKAAGSEPRVEP